MLESIKFLRIIDGHMNPRFCAGQQLPKKSKIEQYGMNQMVSTADCTAAD